MPDAQEDPTLDPDLTPRAATPTPDSSGANTPDPDPLAPEAQGSDVSGADAVDDPEASVPTNQQVLADSTVVPPLGQEQEGPKKKPKDRNLKAAIGVGVGLGVAMVVAARLSPVALLVVVQGFLVVALLELDRAFTMRRSQPPTMLAIAAMPLVIFASWYLGPIGLLMGVLLSFLVGVLGVMASAGQGRAAERFGLYALMVLWVPFLASFLALIMRMDGGIWIALCVFALAASNDIGAYIVGRRAGKRPLAKTISPGKTWEGMIGGLVITVAMSALLYLIVPLPDAIALWQMLALGISVSLASVFGDLFESLIKRDLGVKDLGSILPGHGGVMDRIDAHLFAFPIAWLILTVTGA